MESPIPLAIYSVSEKFTILDNNRKQMAYESIIEILQEVMSLSQSIPEVPEGLTSTKLEKVIESKQVMKTVVDALSTISASIFQKFESVFQKYVPRQFANVLELQETDYTYFLQLYQRIVLIKVEELTNEKYVVLD